MGHVIGRRGRELSFLIAWAESKQAFCRVSAPESNDFIARRAIGIASGTTLSAIYSAIDQGVLRSEPARVRREDDGILTTCTHDGL